MYDNDGIAELLLQEKKKIIKTWHAYKKTQERIQKSGKYTKPHPSLHLFHNGVKCMDGALFSFII